MIVLSVNVSIIVTQCNFINVGDGVGHSVETIRLAIILKEDKVCVRHCENGQDKYKNEIFDVLDHCHQHPNVVSCVSEDANYKIITEHSAYYAKKYRKEGNCIYFNDLSCGCEDGGQEIMVCGNYTIRSIRGEK